MYKFEVIRMFYGWKEAKNGICFIPLSLDDCIITWKNLRFKNENFKMKLILYLQCFLFM